MLKGVKLIDDALLLFSKMIAKLKTGIETCEREIGNRNEKITKFNDENVSLEASVVKARKVIENLEKILE